LASFLAGGREAGRLVRRRLGFLGASPFGVGNPRFWGLEKLGFPWILSSESRLINGLRAVFAGKIFRAPFPMATP
jgi:hypothetical protein